MYACICLIAFVMKICKNSPIVFPPRRVCLSVCNNSIDAELKFGVKVSSKFCWHFTVYIQSGILCFVDRASRYIYVTKTNLTHYLSSVGQPTNRHSTEKHNTYQLLRIYSVPPYDGLQIRPKNVAVDWRNKLKINSASSWFLQHRQS